MRKRVLPFSLFFFIVPSFLIAQKVLDCDSLYARYDSLSKERIGIVVYEKGPEFKGQNHLFLDNTETFTSGKIIARIIVNKHGGIECVEILRSDNEQLNGRAISLLQTLTFAPAELRGRAANAVLVLPVFFGKKLPIKSKVKNRRKSQH